MGETEEFVEALLDQLKVEFDEEDNIAELAQRIRQDHDFDSKFASLAESADVIGPEMRTKLEEFSGIAVPDVDILVTGLDDFKRLKAKKVVAQGRSREFVDVLFEAVIGRDHEKIAQLIKQDATRYFVYSTYAIQYISKISTTYGDYLDSQIHLNEFILDNYPRIVLYRQGAPYDDRFVHVNSGYMGALKMTILEELVHSQQEKLHDANKQAALQVNKINEELAGIIMQMPSSSADALYEHMQLQTVPDDFPLAKKANLFFMLNPDNFIVNVLGPDVMTYSRIEIDPKISEAVPELLGIYQKWLGPIQAHHAAFTAMEGMAEFAVHCILGSDADFEAYLSTFAGTDHSSYMVRKSMGREFTGAIFDKHGRNAFSMILDDPPNTHELKDPARYLERTSR